MTKQPPKSEPKSKNEPKGHEPGKVYKAFSMERVPILGGMAWVFVTLTYQDGHITEIVYSDPDIKAVIIEQFKIAAFKYWSSIG